MEAKQSGLPGVPDSPVLVEAVAFLFTVDDIDDFPAKLGKGKEGILRWSCRGHLCRLFNLVPTQAEEAIDQFLGKQVD